jgi:ABC-type transport system involved in multi-copper enzyme maturation permease subunit
MFATLWAIEQRKTFKRTVFVITLAGTAALLVLLVLGTHFSTQVAAQQGGGMGELPSMLWPSGMVVVLTDFLSPGFIGGIVPVILATAFLVEEYRWGTLQLWLSRGVPRSTVLGAKAAALVLPLLLTLVAATLIGGGASGLLTHLSVGPGSTEQVNTAQLVLSMLRTLTAMLPVAALTLLLGVLTRSTAGTLGAAMGYLLLGEQLLGGLLSLTGLSTAAIYLPITVSTLLTVYNQTLIQGFEATAAIPVGQAPAFAGTLLWTALFLGLAMWRFNRQDLSL